MVPAAPMRKMVSILPASRQIFFRLHWSSSRGMPMGTMTPQTMSSYSTLWMGRMPILAMTMARISAMTEPDILAAQRYFCSKKIAKATDTHITPSRPQVSSGWIRVRPSRFSINDICFLLYEWESRRRRIPAACKYIIPEAPGAVNARNLKILCRNPYKDSSSSKETRSTC